MPQGMGIYGEYMNIYIISHLFYLSTLTLVTFRGKKIPVSECTNDLIQLSRGDMAKYCGGFRNEFCLCIQITIFSGTNSYYSGKYRT